VEKSRDVHRVARGKLLFCNFPSLAQKANDAKTKELRHLILFAHSLTEVVSFQFLKTDSPRAPRALETNAASP